MNSYHLLCSSQSAYRPCHSTETALLRITNDILLALDDSGVAVLILVDLSSAFNTTDHYILLNRLRSLYAIFGTALSWFESYLTGRTQTVTVNDRNSRLADDSFGVPQGTVLGHILFILYSAPLSSLIETHTVSNQSFADDTQLLHSCSPDQVHATVLTMQT